MRVSKNTKKLTLKERIRIRLHELIEDTSERTITLFYQEFMEGADLKKELHNIASQDKAITKLIKLYKKL